MESGEYIKYNNEPTIYQVSFVEENEFCRGGYGVATQDGYYFEIALVSVVEEENK